MNRIGLMESMSFITCVVWIIDRSGSFLAGSYRASSRKARALDRRMREDADGERRMIGWADLEGFWFRESDGLMVAGPFGCDDFFPRNSAAYLRTPEKSCVRGFGQ